MRDYGSETAARIDFIKNILSGAGADGIVFANSGGKDCALAGILCKKACENTVGIIMPCGTKQNYGRDKTDAEEFAAQFEIETRYIDLTETRNEIIKAAERSVLPTETSAANIAPRLRMAALYLVASSENRLVAGTGNRSERHMGYFTKWGDGAFDFNPIADLTVTEVYEFLKYFGVPEKIINKPPSAGLYEGQTDESEMGVTYKSIDEFLLTGKTNERDAKIIKRFHAASGHKRKPPATYGTKD